jgi:hypothetical protein
VKEGDSMIKLIQKSGILSRKMILIFLTIVSITMTTSTFAYWATFVESSESSTQAFLQVGTAMENSYWYEVMNELQTDGYSIPILELLNPEGIDTYSITFDLSNDEQDDDLSNIIINYDIMLYKNGKELNRNLFSRLSKYIIVTPNESNTMTISNDGTLATFNYTVSLDRSYGRSEENLLSELDVVIVFEYSIN